MATLCVVLSFFLLCPLPLIVRYYLRLNIVVVHRTVPAITRLLNPPQASSRGLLASRAIPNARLVRAFSLTNTFVSSEPSVHLDFVGRINLLLRAATQHGWAHFQQVSTAAVDAALLGETRLQFDVFVQDVTLRVALVGLLGVDSNVVDLGTEDIRIVTALITELWSLSKKPDPIPNHLLPELNYRLRRLIPDEETFPNPLDYVIPVWETLWRVVATTVAYAHSDHLARYAFAGMYSLPTLAQFRTFEFSRPSVEAFIIEVMRLHPPSKHIMRATFHPLQSMAQCLFRKGFEHAFTVRHECADIEAVLRSDIWGVDSTKLDSLRQHPSRLGPEQQRTRLLPFGYGRHRCIAASWAPMAVGVIASVVLDRMKEGGEYELIAGKCVGGRKGWGEWFVVKR